MLVGCPLVRRLILAIVLGAVMLMGILKASGTSKGTGNQSGIGTLVLRKVRWEPLEKLLREVTVFDLAWQHEEC